MWLPELDDLSLLEGRELSPCSCILSPPPSSLPIPRKTRLPLLLSSYLLLLFLGSSSQLLACMDHENFFVLRRHKAQVFHGSAPAKPRAFHTSTRQFALQSLYSVVAAGKRLKRGFRNTERGFM